MEQLVFAEFMPEYNAFGIKDETVAAISEAGNIPIIKLRDQDIKRLAPDVSFSAEKPETAFLMGREKGTYTIDYPYAKAIAQSGANLRLLSYDDVSAQMNGCDGLILPGGSFDSPEYFYTDPFNKTGDKPGKRSYAYIKAIIEAEKAEMPILGICAGAQMAGGLHGLKLYRNLQEGANTDIIHKTKEKNAHKIIIHPDSPLCHIVQARSLTVNSRHREGLAPVYDTGDEMKTYAWATDGTPEAWGNANKNQLYIQWHPEDFAADGDPTMQNIYNWHTKKSLEYRAQRIEQTKTNTAQRAAKELAENHQMMPYLTRRQR